jgi:hypothetical protein
MPSITASDFEALPEMSAKPDEVTVNENPSGVSESDFASLPDTKTGFEPPPVEPAETKQAGSLWNDRLTQFNHGFETYAVGGLDLLNSALKKTVGRIPGAIGETVTEASNTFGQNLQSVKQENKADYIAAQARHNAPGWDFAGKVGGSIAAAVPAIMATTTAGPASAANMIGQGVASGAFTGFVDEADSLSDRIGHALTGGLLGGAFGGAVPLAKTVSKLLGSGAESTGAKSFVEKMVNPQKSAVSELANNLKLDAAGSTDEALSNVAKAQSSGMKGMTPGEFSGPNSLTGKAEANIQIPDAMRNQVAQSVIGRADEAKQSIYNVVDSMGTPEIKAAKESGFKAFPNQFITPDNAVSTAPIQGAVPTVVSNNPTLSTLLDKVKNTNKWKDLPENSIEQLHKVKELIDDKMFRATPNKTTKVVVSPLASNVMADLSQARDELTSVLTQSPDYVKAMAASSNLAKKAEYEELIGTIKNKKGTTLENMTDKLFSNDLQANDFIEASIKAGHKPQEITQLLDVAKSLNNAPFRKALENEVAPTNLDSGLFNTAKNFIKDMTLKNYYKALTEISISGPEKWGPKIAEVLKAEKGAPQQLKYMGLIREAAGKTDKLTRKIFEKASEANRKSFYGVSNAMANDRD